MSDPERPYPELARKLAAAVVSHITGFKSVDLFLRKHTPAEVAPIWHEFAAYIMSRVFAQGETSDPKKLM